MAANVAPDRVSSGYRIKEQKFERREKSAGGHIELSAAGDI
jgi:predicted secreted Zn-dependent protease